MGIETRDLATAASDIKEQAAQHTLAANPLVGVRKGDILDTAHGLFGQMMRNPLMAGTHYLRFLGDLGRIAVGASELEPDPRDKRFSDPAWKLNIGYRALAQCHLAWASALNRFVDEAHMDKRDAERARFLCGLENLLGDLVRNGGLPAQVDTRSFAVGKNLTTTKGAVVYRDAVMELIQYQPVGNEVHKRPLLMAPPQINKFYVFDLVPEKSIVRMALGGGLQTFAISWKNPGPPESRFGLDTYVEGLEQAIDVMRDVTRSEDVNIWGSCSGGITTSALLANLAARDEQKVHSATVAVCVLDMAVAQNTTAGIFVTPESIVAAKSASQVAGVVEGRELARMFAWMRPNDLIWNYWVNNYLLGNAPPAFDVLYWNNDTTRLPA